MITQEKTALFTQKLKARLMALGFNEKTAESAAGYLSPRKKEGNTIIADCKSGLYRDTIIHARMNEINEVARECWGPETEIFIRSEPEPAPPVRKKAKPNSTPAPASKPSLESIFDFKDWSPSTQVEDSAKTVSPPASSSSERAVQTLSEPEPLPTFEPIPDLGPSLVVNETQEPQRNRLLPELTFSTFVRGQSNTLAYSACESVARCPGQLTNPVFIYGSTGLGKTHLLHSVGNEIQRRHPDWNIVYVTSDDFVNELIASLRFHRPEAFRNKYRNCDVLLLDDIQFLEKKEVTQIEFFHTFNELYQKRKQIVITSDKYPKDIPNIEERLKSRFLQGLIADIEPPSFEDRVAIIEAKAEAMSLLLTRELVQHIATHVKSNVREIQGVLNNLLMTQHMTGTAPTIEATNTLLKCVVKMQGPTLDIHTVQKSVASFYNIKLSELMSNSKAQKFVFPRHIAMFLAREIIGANYADIAESFGRKDHTTVMHAVEKVKALLEKDASSRASVNELKRKLEQNLL